MDSEIPAKEINRKKRKTILVVVLSIAVIGLLTWFLRNEVKTSIDRSKFTTAVVETGDIENTISASGEIIPEFEQVITSPINAAIRDVLLDAGSIVKPGQSILVLDKAVAQLDLEKGKFLLESKRNSIKKLQLELNKSFYDLKVNDSIKKLRISSLEASLSDAKRLFKAGGGTRESIEQAALNLQVAEVEKKQLENEIASKQQSMRLEIRESEISAQIQEKDLGELARKLALANITASRGGVITWVNKNIGTSIKEGESLVRIADLSSYKLSGSIGDSYSDQLHLGMPAIIRINDTHIQGTVVNIQPSVKNNIVSFDVGLDKQDSKLLRPNLKVDVFLVTAAKSKVLRVANGAAFNGTGSQDIYVVKDGMAVRKTVHTGMSNFDFIELKDGVRAGDVVIVTDMSEYKYSPAIVIKN